MTDAVVIVGCGAIGLPLAAAFAMRGCEVLGVDTDPARLAALRHGKVPDLDEGLGDALAAARVAGRLHFAEAVAAADRPRAFILAVPTPIDAAQQPMLDRLDRAAEAVVRVAHDGDLVVVRATVPVGTTRRLAQGAAALGRSLRAAACPDRSIAGRCLAEQFSVPHIVGGMDREATRAAAALFARLGATIEVSSPEVAEAVKLFANVQRDMTFALANQLALAAQALELDFAEIARAAGEGYPRFSLARPGPVTGPCLTKDTALLACSLARRAPGGLDLALAARALNASLLDHVAGTVARHAAAHAQPRIAVLGLAFKGNPPTADRRGSFGVALAQRLHGEIAHASIRLFEPTSTDPKERDLAAAIAGADVVVVANDHPRIKALDPAQLARQLGRGALIYDACWALAPAAEALPNAVTLRRIGDGRGAHPPAVMASKRAR